MSYKLRAFSTKNICKISALSLEKALELQFISYTRALEYA